MNLACVSNFIVKQMRDHRTQTEHCQSRSTNKIESWKQNGCREWNPILGLFMVLFHFTPHNQDRIVTREHYSQYFFACIFRDKYSIFIFIFVLHQLEFFYICTYCFHVFCLNTIADISEKFLWKINGRLTAAALQLRWISSVAFSVKVDIKSSSLMSIVIILVVIVIRIFLHAMNFKISFFWTFSWIYWHCYQTIFNKITREPGEVRKSTCQ